MCFYIPDPGKCRVCGLEANEVMEDGKIVLYVCSCGETWTPPAIRKIITELQMHRRHAIPKSPPFPPPAIPPVLPPPAPGKSDREQRVEALASMGVVEPVLSELAALAWVTPGYLEEWDRLIWNEKGNLGLGLVIMNIQMGVRAAVARARNGSLYVTRPVPSIAFRLGYFPIPFAGDGGPGIVPYDPAHWRRVEGET